MARIRSIKPEFWTSEQITECSPNARLMFIGLWNFCDDYGVHPASEKRLKMEVFPSDMLGSADIRRMIDELLANKLIEEYEVSGNRYWRVTGWDRHQKIDCKTGLYPLPNGEVGKKIRRTNIEHSPNEQRTFDDHSCKEKEKEKEQKRKKQDSSTFVPPLWVDQQLWDDFIEMRKKIKKPATDRAKQLLVTELIKLVQMGYTQEEIIGNSIKNCWQDFYAPKNSGGSRGFVC